MTEGSAEELYFVDREHPILHGRGSVSGVRFKQPLPIGRGRTARTAQPSPGPHHRVSNCTTLPMAAFMRSARSAVPREIVAALLAIPLALNATNSQLPARSQGFLIAVSNELGHTVTLIDARTLKAIRTIPVPQRPRGIAVAQSKD